MQRKHLQLDYERSGTRLIYQRVIKCLSAFAPRILTFSPGHCSRRRKTDAVWQWIFIFYHLPMQRREIKASFGSNQSPGIGSLIIHSHVNSLVWIWCFVKARTRVKRSAKKWADNITQVKLRFYINIYTYVMPIIVLLWSRKYSRQAKTKQEWHDVPAWHCSFASETLGWIFLQLFNTLSVQRIDMNEKTARITNVWIFETTLARFQKRKKKKKNCTVKNSRTDNVLMSPL